MGTLKLHRNGPLYSNTVIGTLAVDGWVVTFGTARTRLSGAAPPRPVLSVPNVTAHPSTASVLTLKFKLFDTIIAFEHFKIRKIPVMCGCHGVKTETKITVLKFVNLKTKTDKIR